MQDIEEDPKYREKINIYRRERISKPSTTTEDDDKADNDFPALEEILDDLDIKDVEMQETTWFLCYFLRKILLIDSIVINLLI